MIAVACFALIFWAVRSIWQSAPVYGTARSLRTGDAATRRAAVRELEGFTPGEAGVAVPALLEALGDQDAEVAAAAARVLGKKWDAILRSGADPGLIRAVVPGLVEALEDTRPGVRAAAAEGLGFLHGSTPVAEKGDRTGLVEAGPPVRALADRLADDSEEVRRAAAVALRTVGAAYRVPPPDGLFTALEQDPSIPVRAEVARALGHFREGLDPAVFALLKALEQKAPQVRAAAAEGLHVIHALRWGSGGNPGLSAASVPSLIEALGSRNRKVRYHAAALLRRRDPAARAAIPALLTVLTEPAPAEEPSEPTELVFNAVLSDPAIAAVRALGEIAPGTAQSVEVVKALVEVLTSHTSWERRYEAAETLRSSFGAWENEPVIPVMLKVLEEVKPSKQPVGLAAAEALGQLAPGTPWEGQALTALTSALDGAWDSTRVAAARSLARFGPRASAAIPRLKAIAGSDPSPDARKAAADAITAIEATEGRSASDGI
jgi:HEAT repeat protein